MYNYKLLAPGGFIQISSADGEVDDIPGYGIVFREDTQIQTLTDENDTDLVTAFRMSGKTYNELDVAFIIPKDKRIKVIELSSGSVDILL